MTDLGQSIFNQAAETMRLNAKIAELEKIVSEQKDEIDRLMVWRPWNGVVEK